MCPSSPVLYCRECGARLTLFVVGVCERCHFDLTGEDTNREPHEPGSGEPERNDVS